MKNEYSEMASHLVANTEWDLLRFEILGEPVPLARVKFGGHHAYQPKRNIEYRKRIQAAAYEAMKGRSPMTGALEAQIKLYRRYKPTSRTYGDVDNLLKGILDGLNTIVFCDDSQVVRCVVEKYQDKENPRAEITIRVVTEFCYM